MQDLSDTGAMQALLERIAGEARPRAAEGRVADYIPALAGVDPGRFGLALVTAEGREYAAGDADTPFSIQSISKLFLLGLAMEWIGDPLWRRVDREPSGMRFNSLIQLETERGVPRNPFINAGAIVVTDALLERRWNLESSFRNQMRLLAGRPELHYDDAVYRSEQDHGDLNRAIAFVLKAYGNLHGDPMAVANAYFRACSMAMSARELARAATFLVAPRPGPAALAAGRHARGLLALMSTCGLYDQSGEFAWRVGLPGKSGVGGGILAVKPGHFAACAWSPPLDAYGNSVAAWAALEMLAAELATPL